MLIISWNLARNTVSTASRTHDRAWHYLAALDPDIALVQEAMVPEWAHGRWDVVEWPVKRWGSAILAKPELGLAPHSDKPQNRWERDGLLASGTVRLDGETVFLGSVHAPLMKELSEEYLAGLDPSTIKLAAYATPYYYDVPYALLRERAGNRFLVSGDWNVSPILWDRHHPDSHEADFFERAKDDGWVDCYRQFHEDEGRTWFRKSDRPYQLDHAFCDAETARSLATCDVDPYPASELSLSDHAPLLIRLELGLG